MILQLVPRLDGGDIERGTLEIASAVVGAGGRALIAAAGGRLASRLGAVGGEFIELPMFSKNPVALHRTARRLTDLIKAEGIDLIHASNSIPGWSGYRAAQRTGIAFVTTYHRIYAEGMLQRRHDAVMAKGNPTIAVSDFIARMLHERHGVPEERIVTIPRGVDLAVFDPDAVPGTRIAQLADRWGLTDETRPAFLLPGSLVPGKGQDAFIDACAMLRETRGPDFLGLMVGGAPDGSPYPDQLEKRAWDRGCADVIKIVGPCNDMPAAYRMASCAVVASTVPEPHGRDAVEAQAMGRPVIVTNHGGAPEVVDDGLTGAFVEPENTENMAQAMGAFLDLDKTTCDRIAKLARLQAQRQYSIAQMQTATLDAYERAMGRAFPAR